MEKVACMIKKMQTELSPELKKMSEELIKVVGPKFGLSMPEEKKEEVVSTTT